MKQQVYEAALKRVFEAQETALTLTAAIAEEGPPNEDRLRRALEASLDGHATIARELQKVFGK